ncbi:MAG TPA: cytochrome P450 [Spongiibacteraceae bacterium]|jgi:cytochrome P450 PksS
MNLPLLNLKDPAFWQNCFPILNQLREQTRVAITEDGVKVVLRHADVQELLTSGKFLNEGISLLTRRGFKPGDALYEYRQLALGALSGDNHRRFRMLVGRALTEEHVELIRPIATRHMQRLLPPLLNRRIDAIPTLTQPLLLEIIGEFLGIDAEDRQTVDNLVREGQAKAFGREVTQGIRDNVNAIFTELMRFITQQIEGRKLSPKNDVLTRLLSAEVENQTLTQQEIIVFFLNLFIGAGESTGSAMVTGLWLLAKDPALFFQLKNNPALITRFVEEDLRLYPPNTLLANKVAKDDMEFCGVPFAKGEIVMVPLPSPNRDPRVFPQPDSVDLQSKQQRHFALSLGTHFCLGQALARAQLHQFFTNLCRSLDSIELCDSQIKWEPYAAVTNIKELQVKLNAA